MNIRFANAEHAAAIAALHAASWSATYGNVLSPTYLRDVVPVERQTIWRERFANPKANQFILIAEENSVVLGFACAFAGEHPQWGSYVDNLHVTQSHQGRGLGASLLMEGAAICEQRYPGQGLYLSVNQANRRAQQFYLALGAHNAAAEIWNAPDGSQVPTFRFVWESAAALATKRRT